MTNENLIFGDYLYQSLANESGFNEGQLNATMNKFQRIVDANKSPETAFRVVYNAYGSRDDVEQKVQTIKSIIQDEISRVNTNHGKNLSPKTLLEKSVNRFNSLIGKVEFRVCHNGVVYGLDDSDLREMRVEIPKALRDRERLAESYAATAPAKKIKSLEMSVRF